MTSMLPVKETPVGEPVSPEEVRRALSEIPPEALDGSPEDQAQSLDYLLRKHVFLARKHILLLGPILVYARENRLYSYLGYDSFTEWLNREDVGISRSLACDIIGWWKHGMPACIEAGISEEEVLQMDHSKLRNVIPLFRSGLEKEEVRHLMRDVVPHSTWAQLRDYTKNPLGHDKVEDEDQIQFTVHQTGELFSVKANNLTLDQMLLLQRRTRPIWVNDSGDILTFG